MRSNIVVEFVKLNKEAKIPAYKTAGSAGCDLHSTKNVTILPRCTEIIPTGLAVAVPEGYEMQVRPRSGLAAKHGLTVLNAPGTVDSDYRGEVKVILFNNSGVSFRIEAGDRIAQAVFNRVPQALFSLVEQLPDTERGSGGFGSTGK